jgi:hypothetical protein
VKIMQTTIEQTISKKVHTLPLEKQAKVLEYVEEIEIEHSTNGFEDSEEAKQKARLERVMKLCGIGRSKTGDVSQRVDEILAEGINKREGWSLP